MAVTSHDLSRRTQLSNLRNLPVGKVRLYITIGTIILALFALYVVISSAVSWGQVFLDDMRYGNPRTFHIMADVGHGNGTGAPSHLIAMNLDRQVLVFDIPGGDPARMRTLMGPYLFGAGEDLTPVMLKLDDRNGDQHPDLVVNIKDEEIVYLNRDGEFSLLSAGERQQMVEQQNGQ